MQPMSDPSDLSERAMRRAIELASRGAEADIGGPFGAVILRDGEILAEGENRVTSSGDPTAHAEIVAIREACRKLGTFELAGCEIFSSCEPCPMCFAAISWARLERLTFAASREEAARAGFDDARLYRELARPLGERELATRRMLEEEARASFDLWLAKEDRQAY